MVGTATTSRIACIVDSGSNARAEHARRRAGKRAVFKGERVFSGDRSEGRSDIIVLVSGMVDNAESMLQIGMF